MEVFRDQHRPLQKFFNPQQCSGFTWRPTARQALLEFYISHLGTGCNTWESTEGMRCDVLVAQPLFRPWGSYKRDRDDCQGWPSLTNNSMDTARRCSALHTTNQRTRLQIMNKGSQKQILSSHFSGARAGNALQHCAAARIRHFHPVVFWTLCVCVCLLFLVSQKP